MTSQQPHKTMHTKILDVFRSKSLKKNVKDPRQTLFFKIKPQKSVSQLIIPYRDLKDNFPFALIQYYETKIKIKNDAAKSFQQLLIESDKNSEKLKPALSSDKREYKKGSKGSQKGQKSFQQENKDIQQEQNSSIQPILDYDYFLQQKDMPLPKPFHAVFSETQPNENRYLKDLNNDENNMYARRNHSNSPNYEGRRKKVRIDYQE